MLSLSRIRCARGRFWFSSKDGRQQSLQGTKNDIKQADSIPPSLSSILKGVGKESAVANKTGIDLPLKSMLQGMKKARTLSNIGSDRPDFSINPQSKFQSATPQKSGITPKDKVNDSVFSTGASPPDQLFKKAPTSKLSTLLQEMKKPSSLSDLVRESVAANDTSLPDRESKFSIISDRMKSVPKLGSPVKVNEKKKESTSYGADNAEESDGLFAGSAIRSAIRQANLRRPGGINARPQPLSEPHASSHDEITGSARAVQAEVLRSLTETVPEDSSDAPATEIRLAGGSAVVGVDEMTPGEARYLQHQEHLKRQKEALSHRTAPHAPPWSPRNHFAQGGGRKDWMPRHASAGGGAPHMAAAGGRASQQASAVGGTRPGPPGGYGNHQQQYEEHQQPASGPLELDVAELKKRLLNNTASRAQQQQQQGGGGAWPAYGSYRQKQQRAKPKPKSKQQQKTVVKEVSVPAAGLTVRELASRLSMKTADLRKQLEALGEEIVAPSSEEAVACGAAGTLGLDDYLIDPDVAELALLELGVAVKREKLRDEASSRTISSAGVAAAAAGDGSALALVPRAPVVCIMGHVDHGKTTLLDSLRRANVAAGEAGGITQKLSAFTVPVAGRRVVFLDTPGHAAFSAMRSNGVSATDLVVLVVAMDDGVRPQTIEAIRCAQEANATMIVALNKVDRIPAGAERTKARGRVLQQLVELDVVPEEYGGSVFVVEVAGRTGEGLEALTEGLLLQADILELKAAPVGQAEATVLDAVMEKGRGVVADVLVRWGSLKVGDAVVVGTSIGRVKAMVDDCGKPVQAAGPSMPVRLMGLRTVPTAGQELISVPSEARARVIAERREKVQELRRLMQQGVQGQQAGSGSGGDGNALSSSSAQEGGGGDIDGTGEASTQTKAMGVNVILKADGVGTLQALEQVVSATAAKTKDVVVSIVATSVGDVTQSDIERASTVSNSVTIVLGFNIGVADAGARSLAKELDVRIVRDTVIYRLEDELKSTMENLMPKDKTLTREGLARVLKVFPIRDKNSTLVAGLSVSSGVLRMTGAKGTFVYRVNRKGVPLAGAEELTASQLKRFKDSVYEVEQGNECGLALHNHKDFQEGDEIECLKLEWKPRKLFQ